MRIAFLAAGAGDMYCGSCLLDNRLAATLIAQRRDVVLFPLYAPIRTDEDTAESRPIFYGGINVCLEQSLPKLRWLPRAVTRILDARWLLTWASRFAGRTRPEYLGALTVSVLKGPQGAQRKELGRLIHALKDLQPDLVHLPNLMFAGLAGPIKAALSVPVLCTLAGEDIFLDGLPERHRREVLDLIRQRSHDVDGFTAVTKYYASHAAARFTLPPERIHVVPMGVKTDDVGEPADPPPRPFTIGYLARIGPEKGLANLADAYAKLRQAGRHCRLRAAGWISRSDHEYLGQVRRRLSQAGADDGFEYVGEVDRAGKLAFLRSLHMLSVPTVYHEAKGLYVLEAMACGVPVVQPRHGAFPEIVEPTGGGLLYDPAGPTALAVAIAQLMDDPPLRARLGASGRTAVFASFTDGHMAEHMWSLYDAYVRAT